MIGKLKEELWIELKTEDWIIKAFHQSVNQSHVLSTLFHVEYQLGTGEHYEEKGKSRFSLQGAFIIKRKRRKKLSYRIR